MINYILVGNRPVPEPNLLTFGAWYEKADRHVAKTQLGEVYISTVFLGIDHNFGEGPPVLFETMVFGGKLEGEQERYCTWEQAEAGHKDMVARVKEAECSLDPGKEAG